MKKLQIAFLILILSFAAGIYFYPLMPGIMASHWDISGNVNGYIPKFWGVFMLPLVLTAMLVLFVLIPKIDPLKKNIEKFGLRFSMGGAMSPAIGGLMFFMGILLEKAERNWFIGIRTPWTLSSDRVWKKTHEAGSWLFKVLGLLLFAGLFLSSIIFWAIIAGAVGISLFLFIYSYFLWKKEK